MRNIHDIKVVLCECPILIHYYFSISSFKTQLCMWYTGLVYYDIYASVVRILQFPNTSSPGIAGFVSWTAASSVFICLVKLLPLAVTMVTIRPGSVACRGVRRTSLS